jgi:hypothetical protein
MRWALAAAAVALAALPGSAGAARALAADAHDEVIPLVRRIDAYFRANKVDDVTLDSRFAINPSEAIRQGVVCQLLGYAELCKAHPSKRFVHEIARHADYLTTHLLQVNSGTPFDGMLGYSLVLGFEFSRDSTHLAAAQVIVDELKAIPTSECILNGGLMVAMAMVEWAKVTGDADAMQKGRDIIAQVVPYQRIDGSFPHWCSCSKDIHYTGWMSQELILLGRELHDPAIDQMLAGTAAFEDDRMDAQGLSHYEEACPDYEGCVVYYDSKRSGCYFDYDTRGITVEPGYMTLLFEHAGKDKFDAAIHRLLALENVGTFKDKWDYIEPPGDPQYPWSTADTSVANMSIIFWSMATILSGHAETAHEDSLWHADEGSEDPIDATEPLVSTRRVAVPLRQLADRLPPAERVWRTGLQQANYCDGVRPPAAPAPATASVLALSIPPPGSTHVAFSLPGAAMADLRVYDVTGRLVRTLLAGELPAGEHVSEWDRRDAIGRRVAAGVYLVRLRSGDAARTARIVLAP